MISHPQKTNQFGFSLIEILLVCSIITLLAAILFPVLPQAKSMAYREQCASNMRQLGTAFTLYANDWSDYWPSPSTSKGDYWAQLGFKGLRRYVRQQGALTVWCCPTTEKSRAGLLSPRSYFMNCFLRTPADTEEDANGISCGLDISKLSSSAKSILIYEGKAADDADYKSPKCGNWKDVNGYKILKETTHSRYNNYLFCDGHITTRAPGRCSTGLLSTYSEMYQWYVNKPAYEMDFKKRLSKLIPRS